MAKLAITQKENNNTNFEENIFINMNDNNTKKL